MTLSWAPSPARLAMWARELRARRRGQGLVQKPLPPLPAKKPMHTFTSWAHDIVHPQEALLRRAGAEQKSPEWQARYKATRPVLERKVSHFTRRPWGGRKARVRGARRITPTSLPRCRPQLGAPGNPRLGRWRPWLGIKLNPTGDQPKSGLGTGPQAAPFSPSALHRFCSHESALAHPRPTGPGTSGRGNPAGRDERPKARPGRPPAGSNAEDAAQVTALPRSCLLSSWVVMASLRGLAASMTGMVRVSTPAL